MKKECDLVNNCKKSEFSRRKNTNKAKDNFIKTSNIYFIFKEFFLEF